MERLVALCYNLKLVLFKLRAYNCSYQILSIIFRGKQKLSRDSGTYTTTSPHLARAAARARNEILAKNNEKRLSEAIKNVESRINSSYSLSNFGWGVCASIVVEAALALTLVLADTASGKENLAHVFNGIANWMWQSFCGQLNSPNPGECAGMIVFSLGLFSCAAGTAAMLIGGKSPAPGMK